MSHTHRTKGDEKERNGREDKWNEGKEEVELFRGSDRGGEKESDIVSNKGDDVVVCLPGAKIEVITERVENIVGSGKGGSILVHVGTNNAES